ncbi:diguanylate cyclase domain-containing protein [Rhodopirellula europaea]|uniref:diguanylate cyclase n=1 Tax=Rhodopirellula europaea 6C TaxID=1263867 RepID=M2B2G2_9BACT|nr:diguanylate cyclase [Rhodopirellula europaea]EMB15963.1 GGDEF domain-containing protein [Rhodopirellula europaea 6C]
MTLVSFARVEAIDFTLNFLRAMSAADPFAIAKAALQRVGQFNTPPTPEVFEVWYRYIEGLNENLTERLDYVVNETQSVDTDMLLTIHKQHCLEQETIASKVSRSLVEELRNAKDLLNEQQTVGSQFGNSVGMAGKILSSESIGQDQIVRCVKSLARETAEIHSKFEEMSQKLAESQSQVNALENDLSEMNKALLVDHLTGIGNRRCFDSLIDKSLRMAPAEDCNVYLAIMDLDEFKAINDTFGQDTGDDVIQFVAKSLADLRPEIPVARLGGDEFAVVLANMAKSAVEEFEEDLRAFFSKKRLVSQSTGETIGFLRLSIGIAKRRPDDDAKSWMSRADQLLYEAKKLGRNRSRIDL